MHHKTIDDVTFILASPSVVCPNIDASIYTQVEWEHNPAIVTIGFFDALDYL